MRAVVVAFAACLLAASAAKAEYAGPVHSVAEIERFRQYHGPGRSAHDGWRDSFLGQRFNRAMAVSPRSWGVASGHASEESAIETAMRNCTEQVKRANATDECRLYAVNNRIVWPGQEFGLPHLEIGFGAFTFRNEYAFQGPQRAKGILVWQHGYGGRCNEARGNAAWSVVTRFNLAGWDVVRFDRDPCLDGDLAWIQSQLLASVPTLREAGYRKIVLAGQSRGGWQSLEFLAKGQLTDLVDGVLAISPARHGEATQRANLVAPEDWRVMMNGIRPGGFVVATVFFGWDPYVPQAEQQTATARTVLSAKGVKNAIIYETGEDIVPLRDGKRNGHSAASSGVFTNRYSVCLIRFIESGEKTDACR